VWRSSPFPQRVSTLTHPLRLLPCYQANQLINKREIEIHYPRWPSTPAAFLSHPPATANAINSRSTGTTTTALQTSPPNLGSSTSNPATPPARRDSGRMKNRKNSASSEQRVSSMSLWAPISSLKTTGRRLRG